MNKFIKEQLLKTKAKVPPFDDNTTQLLIRRANGKLNESGLQLNHCYLAYVEDYVVNEPENFTLSTNWNNGTKPAEYKLYIKVMQVMGKMVKVYSQGLTTNIIWEGWLPQKAITIMEELNV